MEAQRPATMDLLPLDALEAVLRRLPPRSLAVCRSVRRSWRDAVDGGRLLRADLLPHKLSAMVINYECLTVPEFLSRPTTGPAISGKLNDFLPDPKRQWSPVQDHCNGLLLLYHCVVNPATRRWAPLPPPPTPQQRCFYHDRSLFHHEQYLVFDPTVSLHYEVFDLPVVRHRAQLETLCMGSSWKKTLRRAVEKLEWPPSPWVLKVFSSRTGQWEERVFLRQGGDAPGTLSDVRMSTYREYQATYRRDRLYVRCSSNFVLRLSLSSNKYQTIKLPALIQESEEDYYELCMGSSEHGVYCAFVVAESRLFV